MTDEILTKIMKSVRVEIRVPMQIRVSKSMKGKITDSHTFEVEYNTKIEDVQKQVTQVASRWKGGFEIGTQYIVERLE